ncbi:MAG: type IV secretory system conjugative DNA transfer family protein [Hyphomicrobiales bacterium]|uniref:type IV secretory system conjugative DNA transfer family protein n=1 Tax=Alphaproteobacteria TaxID=28211 RepID=UPI00329699D4
MDVVAWFVRQAVRIVWFGLLLVGIGLHRLPRLIRFIAGFRRQATHGSAQFAGGRRIAKLGLFDERGFIVGKHKGHLLRYGKGEHLLTYAPTRKGKGIGAVIPNLLDHPGSAVVMDIKGENAAITARQRCSFGRVLIFDPFDLDRSAAYNPMDFIRPDHAEDDAEALADLLVIPSGHDHFDPLARAMVLYVHHTHWSDPKTRTLQEVRRLLSISRDEFEEFLEIKLMQSPITAVRNAAATIQKAAFEELSSILTSASRNMGVWDKPNVERISCSSDLRLEDLKSGVVSVYLTIPPDALHTYYPWLRVMIGQLIAAMTRAPTMPDYPVLFMLDEFPALGRMAAIEKGIGYLAGYGVSLWLITQDLHQVANVYKGQAWKSIVANCTIRQCFGVQDADTAEMVSRMLGTTTVRSHSEGYASNVDQFLGRRNENQSEAGRALLTPGEILTLEDDEMILFCKGWPVRAKKLDYRREWRFRGMWDEWFQS